MKSNGPGRLSGATGLLAALLFATSVARGDIPDDITCRDWLNLPADQRPAALGPLLTRRFGPPASSALSGCLHTLAPELGARLYALCLSGEQDYAAALGQVLDAGERYCVGRAP